MGTKGPRGMGGGGQAPKRREKAAKRMGVSLVDEAVSTWLEVGGYKNRGINGESERVKKLMEQMSAEQLEEFELVRSGFNAWVSGTGRMYRRFDAGKSIDEVRDGAARVSGGV